MATTVRVNRKLIDYALQQISTQCAIALALKDADDYWSHPYVDQDVIRVTDTRTQQRYTFKTSEKIAKWIDQFDTDPSQAKPLTFTLDLESADKVKPVKRASVERLIHERDRVREHRTHQAEALRFHRPLRAS